MTTTADERRQLLRRYEPGRATTPEARALAQHRAKAARAAVNAGRDPRDEWAPDDLARMFTDDELDELVAAADARRDRRRTGEARIEAERTLAAMIERIEAEHAEARRHEIEADARRRLGWPDHGLPDQLDPED